MKICKCKSCGASIVWITTQKGKNMPCDADAVEYQENYKGKSTIVTEDGRVLKVSIITSSGGVLAPIVDGKGYIPHWATCPYANNHRTHSNAAPAAKPDTKPSYVHAECYFAAALDPCADLFAAMNTERRKQN